MKPIKKLNLDIIKKLRLDGYITQITKHKVWEMVKDGKSFYEFIEQISDELYQWIKDTEESFNSEYKSIEGHARESLEEILGEGCQETRKEIALKILKCNNSSVMFMMLDEKDYRQCIWKILEPVHEFIKECMI